ncbi:HNH endonuclease signature motif containing protein [Nesterenkonia ebinurensis]|uniref:HNH endonuclease signature motif containing protein n=1 Tax=Nesterenkonia ebinurensis TaxID=2608252 RepID=UPI00123CCEBE|nr:HNH endonuclease signature motif containing protein [Nesterenkonia ebinurensis]
MNTRPTTTPQMPVTPGGPGTGTGSRGHDDDVGSSVCPVLPEGYAHLTREPELVAAWEEEVVIRRAEARKIQLLVDYRERRLLQEEPQHTFSREAVLKAVHREAALMLGVPEGQVRRMLTTAETAQEWLPKTWKAYQAGRIDLDRVQKIAEGVRDLIETNTGKPDVQRELTGALDDECAQVTAGENRNTLARKVRNTVAGLDTEGHQRRYEIAKTKRYVSFTRHDDGMTTLKAKLSWDVLEPVEQQLHTLAGNTSRKRENAEGQSQEATYYNRMADILADWLTIGAQGETADPGRITSGAGRRAPVKAAGVNITIPLDTLTGASDAPAVSTDGRFILPAAEARRITGDPEVEKTFYLTGTKTTAEGKPRPVRIVKLGKSNPLTGVQGLDAAECAEATTRVLAGKLTQGKNLLEAESVSRFVTGNLRAAVLLRDGHCQTAGCTEPGFRADIDHKTSYETGGATNAANAQVLCHHHHEMKSHGLLPELQPSTDRSEEPEQARASPTPTRHDREGTQPDRPPDWALGEAV